MMSKILPRGLVAWWERQHALHDLQHLQEQDDAALELDDMNFVNRAKASVEVGDKASAEHYWNQALSRYPRFARKSRHVLQILFGLGRFDEAEALMLEGRRREPREPFYAGGYALVAEQRGALEEAIRRWAAVRRAFPGYWMGYVKAAGCLRRAGRLDEADTLLRTATRRFPRHVETWWEWAVVAEERGDWAAALQRWGEVADFRHGYGEVGSARALERLHRLDEAKQRLKQAQLAYPLDPEIVIALAQFEDRHGDMEAAVSCWADFRRKFPKQAGGYQEAIRLLRGVGRLADAEAIAKVAMATFPEDAWPAVEHASLASERHDWEAAMERWARVRQDWPDREEGYRMGAEALMALGRQQAADEILAGRQAR